MINLKLKEPRLDRKIDPNINKYRNYWQNNLQCIEDISKNLEKHIYKLEKKYSDFDSIYNDITYEMDILSSIYSNYNNLKGKEYLLKLRTLLKEYKKRYTHEGINFDAIYNLQSKIDKLRQVSFEKFPSLEHSSYILIDEEENYTQPIEKAPYQWITFQRNGSWFIIKFDSFQVVKFNDAELLTNNGSDAIRFGDRTYEVINFFSQFTLKEETQPNYYLMTSYKGVTKCFAVKKLGKRILAQKDFILPQLKPFKKSRISSGRIRIFGKYHIYLKS